eukprot:9406128-Pyramimonas_sp.AAC.1
MDPRSLCRECGNRCRASRAPHLPPSSWVNAWIRRILFGPLQPSRSTRKVICLRCVGGPASRVAIENHANMR